MPKVDQSFALVLGLRDRFEAQSWYAAGLCVKEILATRSSQSKQLMNGQ